MFEVYGLEIVFFFFWFAIFFGGGCKKLRFILFRFDNHQYLDIIHQEDPIRAYHQIQNYTHSPEIAYEKSS